MRKLLLFTIACIAITGCLKKDILADDTSDANFKESEFFKSGKFKANFNLILDNISVSFFINPSGDTLCKPVVTLHLDDDYAAALGAEWSDEVFISIKKDNFSEAQSYPLSPPYTQPVEYRHTPINCDGIIDITYSLELIDPNTTKVSANTTRHISISL